MTQAPTELKLHRQSRELEVGFPDGVRFMLPCELLRVFSPSAEVRGHGAGERKLMTGKKYVNIEQIDLVGNYAIRIAFDDGHDTGIYAWEYLRELGEQRETYWQRYLDELSVANCEPVAQHPDRPLAAGDEGSEMKRDDEDASTLAFRKSLRRKRPAGSAAFSSRSRNATTS